MKRWDKKDWVEVGKIFLFLVTGVLVLSFLGAMFARLVFAIF